MMWTDSPAEVLARALSREAVRVQPSPNALARIRARIALFSKKPAAVVPAAGSTTPEGADL